MFKCRWFNFVSLALIVNMLLGLAACAPAATPLPTDTATPVPSLTPSSTLTPTPTFTPIPTSTPTLTPTPTSIPSATPSPTPEGYYSSKVLGFSLIYPKGWELTEKEDSVEFQDPIFKTAFIVQSSEDSGLVDYDSYIGPVITFFKSLFMNYTVSKKSEFKLGDGTPAVMQVISGRTTSKEDLIIQVASARAGTRIYFFAAMVFGSSTKDKLSLIDGIFKSIYLSKNPDEIVTIKIASQSPLSGNMSAAGQDIVNGAELALAQLGDPLRSMGFRLELVPFDDQGSPNTGVANAKQIVADPAILCVVGHYNSGVQIPSSEVYHTANLANVSPANTNPKVTDRGYLELSRIVGRDDIQAVAGARFAKARGIKTVFVVHDTTVYGSGTANIFKQEAESLGIQVLGIEGTEEMKNFTALLESVLPAKPDLIYFGGMADQIAEFFKQARNKGYKGMFLSVDGFDSQEAAVVAGNTLLQGKGTFFTEVAGPASVYPGTAKFVTDFKAKYKHDAQPFAAQGYDAMGVCLRAIENAASASINKMPTRKAVSEAVRALKDYKGITGTINFDKNGDLLLAKYFVVQVVYADPASWTKNRIVQTLEITPP